MLPSRCRRSCTFLPAYMGFPRKLYTFIHVISRPWGCWLAGVAAVFADLSAEARELFELYHAGHVTGDGMLWDLCLSPAPADVHAIKILISDGANVNHVGAHGWRPLHLAAMNNDVPVIDALVRAGAELEARCDVRMFSQQELVPASLHCR